LNISVDNTLGFCSPFRWACIQRATPSRVSEMPPAGLQTWCPYFVSGTGATAFQRFFSRRCGHGSRFGSVSAGSPKTTERMSSGVAISLTIRSSQDRRATRSKHAPSRF
jgi:hypothetical protein